MKKSNTSKILKLVLKAVALGMGAASIVLGLLQTANLETQVTLLGIGLFAIALYAFQDGDEPD